MKISNNTIEEIFMVLKNQTSFKNNINIKLPAKIRYATRTNEERLKPLYNTYLTARKEIIQRHLDDGHCYVEDGSVRIDDKYTEEIQKELVELATIENDVDICLIDKDVMNLFLETAELSIPEENLLLLMTKGA